MIRNQLQVFQQRNPLSVHKRGGNNGDNLPMGFKMHRRSLVVRSCGDHYFVSSDPDLSTSDAIKNVKDQ